MSADPPGDIKPAALLRNIPDASTSLSPSVASNNTDATNLTAGDTVRVTQSLNGNQTLLYVWYVDSVEIDFTLSFTAGVGGEVVVDTLTEDPGNSDTSDYAQEPWVPADEIVLEGTVQSVNNPVNQVALSVRGAST